MRDYPAEIAAATAAGDVAKLAALAIELAQRAAVADDLERKAAERRERAAAKKRRQRSSHDVPGTSPGQTGTEGDVAVLPPSPLVPPFPPPTPTPNTPLNPPNPGAPRAATRGRAKCEEPSRPPATSRPHWLSPVAAAYEAAKGAGTFPWSKAGGQLKPLHEAGHSGAVIAERLTRYLAATEARFVSLPKFRETFGDWAPSDEPLVDEMGCLTAAGWRETAGPGMRGAA